MGKSAGQIIGYKYFMGIHGVLGLGPFDAITKIDFDGRVAWEGENDGSTRIEIDKPDLFGGDTKEGGLVGIVDVLMGGVAQGKSPYLTNTIGPVVPAYRGLVSLIFSGFNSPDTLVVPPDPRDVGSGGYRKPYGSSQKAPPSFLWGSNNPYFKAPKVTARRVLKGWRNDDTWYPEKALIGTLDMNPAHIIYQALTDRSWGMGYSISDIDDTSFRAAADVLHGESFGISIRYNTQGTVGDFIKSICNHIGAAGIPLDLRTGKFQLKLIRDDYVVGDLININPSNILELQSFQRKEWSETSNEVVVKYTGRNRETLSVVVQDLASVDAQGAIVSITRDYPGIREPDVAARVAMRDLITVASPMAKITVVTNRVLFELVESDVFTMTWPELGMTNVPFRIAKINKGSLVDGRITVEAIEDVFGMPDNAYVAHQPGVWNPPILAPVVAPMRSVVVEAPYWEVIRNVRPADYQQLLPDYAFAQAMSIRGEIGVNEYSLIASSDNARYWKVASGQFNAAGVLTSPIPLGAEEITFTLLTAIDLPLFDGPANAYLYVDNEIMAVTSLDTATGECVARRGCLDTVPAAHEIGAYVYFADGISTDPSEYVDGETVYFKVLPRNGHGELSGDLSPAISLEMIDRAQRPYPPANFKINGTHYPAGSNGEVLVSWSHRDRTQQTVSVVRQILLQRID